MSISTVTPASRNKTSDAAFHLTPRHEVPVGRPVNFTTDPRFAGACNVGMTERGALLADTCKTTVFEVNIQDYRKNPDKYMAGLQKEIAEKKGMILDRLTYGQVEGAHSVRVQGYGEVVSNPNSGGVPGPIRAGVSRDVYMKALKAYVGKSMESLTQQLIEGLESIKATQSNRGQGFGGEDNFG